MRQWAEEKRSGTLEVLMTLPIKSSDLVLGKFLAGLALVALALALTLPLPLTVNNLGDLDWGPVWGGYLAALLLASTYLAIGLSVSSRTDNQVVALMVTLVIGGLLYVVGTEKVAGLGSQSTADFLRAIGTSSRFENVERGVIDMRDLAYYVGLTAFFLALNTFFVERQRLDTGSPHGRALYTRQITTVALVGLNVAALVVWLAPVTALRIDLTQNGDYSLSPVTKTTLAQLDEPLTIEGFFSQKTHPLLQPLVPQLHDLIDEYQVYGHGKVHVKFADPNSDDQLEQQIQQQYGIRSIPFRVQGRHEQSVVNSYFQVLVKYGDQYQVLGIDDLIDVNQDENGLDVRLRNPEYAITRAIRRVSQDFTSTEALLAKLPQQATITAYISPGTLPDDMKKMPDTLQKVVADLKKAGGDKLAFQMVDPSKDPAVAKKLADDYGIQPFAQDLMGHDTFWAHIVLQVGKETERLVPNPGMSEADLKKAFEGAFKRAVPGELKSVGIVTSKPPEQNPNLPPQYRQPQQKADYQSLHQALAQDFSVQDVDVSGGVVPDDLDVMLIGKPGKLDDKARFAIDQYLMRGGSVIALASGWHVEANRQGIKVKANAPDLLDLLDTYGVKVSHSLLMDAQNAPFPVPVQEHRGPFTFQRIEMIPYPFFPDIRQDGFASSNMILAGLDNVTLPWGSPLTVDVPEAKKGEKAPIDTTVLLRTSSRSWTNDSGDIQPDFQKYPKAGFSVPSKTRSKVVAVALTGTFPSYFDKHQLGDTGDFADRVLKQSLPGARLVVLGSSDIASDLMLGFASQMGGEVHRPDLQLVENAIDWAVEDPGLAQIRSAGEFARTLEPLTEQQRRNYELGNYLVVLLAMGLIVVLPKRRRKFEPPKPSPTLLGEPHSAGGTT